jgi:hypothetical protein
MKKPNRTVLVVVADTHAGSSTGLLPKGNWTGMDGQTVQRSTGQRVLGQQWDECWERVAQLRKGARLVVVHNGDAIDGFHHNTTQVITNNTEEQKQMHLGSMDDALQRVNFKKSDQLYYVYGTESHVGGTEEAIARDLGAVPCIEPTSGRDGRYVHYRLKLNVNGVRFDIAHHGIGAGGRMWTRTNGCYLAAKDHYLRSLEYGTPRADYLIASHFHEYITAVYDGHNGSTRAIITPAFQLKTAYGNRVARHKLASIGLVIIVIEADGRHYMEVPLVTYDEIGEIKL